MGRAATAPPLLLHRTATAPPQAMSDALVHAGVAIDALFDFVQSDKLKLADLFERIDRDNSGTLERDELAMCLTMLGVEVQESHLDAIFGVLDRDGDGEVVIAEFFESMEQLKSELKAARKAAVHAEAESVAARERLRRAEEARGTVSSAFFTILRARGGIGPGVKAPREWNRVDCDGERGVLPSKEKPWEKPPERPKDPDVLHGKGWKKLRKQEKAQGVGWWSGSGAEETAGWEPSLPALLTKVCTPTPPGTEVCFDEAALQQFFTTLRLDSLAIRRIDPKCAGFRGLERLCLVGNEITTIENLPGELRQLDLSTNRIGSLPKGCGGWYRGPRAAAAEEEAETSRRAGGVPLASRLQGLSLAYNRLTDEGADLAQHFGELVSLDLSFNMLCDLPTVLEQLQPTRFGKLRHLYLDGNPFCLRPHYRLAVLAALPALTMLDGEHVTAAMREKAAACSRPTPPEALSPRRLPSLGAALAPAGQAELRVALDTLSVIDSPSWPRPVTPEPGEDGEEAPEPEPVTLDLGRYRYTVRYALQAGGGGGAELLAGASSGDGAELEPQDGVEWTGEVGPAQPPAGAAQLQLSQQHTVPCDVPLRDALMHGQLCVELWETAVPPPPSPEEGEADAAEPDGEDTAPAPEPVLIGVGVAAADPTDASVVGAGLRVESLLTEAVASVYGLGEHQAQAVLAVRFVAPPPPGSVVDRAGASVANVGLTLTLNQEADAPPPREAETPEVPDAKAGGKGKKKK
eukprot:COSAG01_NODE_3760_length_5722_cov_5.035390_1_plen_747_part_00